MNPFIEPDVNAGPYFTHYNDNRLEEFCNQLDDDMVEAYMRGDNELGDKLERTLIMAVMHQEERYK